jgi:hypothetical protein
MSSSDRPITLGVGQSEGFGGQAEYGREPTEHGYVAQPAAAGLEPGDRGGRAAESLTEPALGPAPFLAGMTQYRGVITQPSGVPQSR